ncbi:hypothetical protein BGZ83_008487 [Gryganskiella cystojenkinii]|nr:hypothetical protein BGZ83_008487 [Gryganskiella cystojenkinii]
MPRDDQEPTPVVEPELAIVTPPPSPFTPPRPYELTRTHTTITWPPIKETHIITARLYDGAITSISAQQSMNVTLFPNYTLSITTTTTRPPPTTVVGLEPPPPYVSGSPTNESDDPGTSKATTIRTWALVVAGIVLLALVGGLLWRRYRMRIGRAKKQEPARHFVSVDEDDGESDRGRGHGLGGGSHSRISISGLSGVIDIGGTGGGTGGGTTETLPDGSIALSNLGGGGGGSSSQQNYNNQVRERRNSQPVPRKLELDGKHRP